MEVEKIVLVNQFFDSYPSALNNSQKIKMKQSFLELVKMLQEKDLIEPTYKVISGGQFYSTDELIIKNISEGFVIYETLVI